MKGASTPLFLLVTALIAAAPFAAAAQVSDQLSPEDSAAIRVTMLELMLDGLAQPEADSARVWIRPYAERDPATGERRPVPLTPAEWRAISQAFPNARKTQASDTLFLCPPGVEVRMPGRGCPILGDRLIVRFAPLIIKEGSVETGGTLTQSAAGRRGPITWAQGIRVLLRRVDGAWRLERVTGRAIT